MSLQLFTYPENPRAYKALIAAKYAGVEIDVPKFEFGTDNKNSDFLEMNPLGKVPTLLTAQGPIFESNAIARYVARLSDNQLFGMNNYQHGLVDQWIDFSVNEIEYAAITWLGPVLGFLPYQKPAVEKAKETINASLKVLDDFFEYQTFLVTNDVTLADITLFCTLLGLYKYVLDFRVRATFPHVTRWFMTCLHQPQFQSVVGDFEFCVSEAQAQPAKKDKKEKAQKSSEQKAPKESQSSSSSSSSQKEVDAEPENPVEEPKAKNPVDDLPPSSMNLNDWKVLYSNTTETRAKCMPWLWENVDAGWSFWYCDYKFDDELTNPLFMTSNLVSGYFARAEACRKYAFSSMLICGKSSKQSIFGVWMTRGQDFLNVLSAVDDTELYNWRKIDVSDPKERELVEDVFCWDRPVNELEVLDGKIFK